MKKTLELAAACVLAACAVVRAQDAPKLVGEKTIMKLDDGIEHRRSAGAWWMRLSPRARRVLYVRQTKWMYKTRRKDGTERQRRGYKLVLRDLKTGKDTPVPIPALFDRGFAIACLSMTVFDAAGKTLVVPVGEDANKDDYWEPRPPLNEKCKLGLYDIASGKLKTPGLKADLIVPTYHPNGKTLVVLAMERDAKKAKVHVTPTDKIRFRLLSKPGFPRSLCPTSDLMAMLVLSEGQRPRRGKFVLYDLKGDTVKAELIAGEEIGKMTSDNPQWTADGRYLYYAVVKEEERDGRKLRKVFTRIWDAKAGKEAGTLSGVCPIGAGPGAGTMVLTKLPHTEQRPRAPGEIVLHAQGDKTLGQELHRLGDASTRPISTQGKWLLFIRKDANGNEAACMAEIALPRN